MLQQSLFTLLFLIFSFALKAQYSNEQKVKIEETTNSKLKTLMNLVEKRHYNGFGKMMAYAGKDPNRNLKSRLNLSDPHEKLKSENTLNRIAHYLKKSALWHAQNFRIVKGFEADLYIWDLEFTLLNGKSKVVKMTFINLKGEYLFCHLDKS